MWDTSRTQVGHKGYTNGNEIICPKANVKKQDKCRQVRSECETKKSEGSHRKRDTNCVKQGDNETSGKQMGPVGTRKILHPMAPAARDERKMKQHKGTHSQRQTENPSSTPLFHPSA